MYNALMSKGLVKPDMSNWMRDPYDAGRHESFLVNLGADTEYDAMFPEHPLSLAHELMKWVVKEL